jgi:hypothetical protein
LHSSYVLGTKEVDMTKYMLILGGADLDKRSGNPNLAPAMFERYFAWMKSLQESGRYVASHKLQDRTGTRLTVRGGNVVEGPFIEAKEAVGGIFVVNAESLDEATAIARNCAVLHFQNGYVEVRAIDEVRPAGR